MIFCDLVASTLQKKVYLLFHLMTERSDMGSAPVQVVTWYFLFVCDVAGNEVT